jgi:hypothetical protein
MASGAPRLPFGIRAGAIAYDDLDAALARVGGQSTLLSDGRPPDGWRKSLDLERIGCAHGEDGHGAAAPPCCLGKAPRKPGKHLGPVNDAIARLLGRLDPQILIWNCLVKSLGGVGVSGDQRAVCGGDGPARTAGATDRPGR